MTRDLRSSALTAMSVGAVILIVVSVLVLFNVAPTHIVTPAEIAGYVGLGFVVLGAVGILVAPRRKDQAVVSDS